MPFNLCRQPLIEYPSIYITELFIYSLRVFRNGHSRAGDGSFSSYVNYYYVNEHITCSLHGNTSRAAAVAYGVRALNWRACGHKIMSRWRQTNSFHRRVKKATVCDTKYGTKSRKMPGRWGRDTKGARQQEKSTSLHPFTATWLNIYGFIRLYARVLTCPDASLRWSEIALAYFASIFMGDCMTHVAF